MFESLNIVLASASPRRSDLLKQAGIPFRNITPNFDESIPTHIAKEDVALFLAKAKAKQAIHLISQNETLLTADTIVLLDNTVLGKPINRKTAVEMLNKLSGKTHLVISGVCIVHQNQVRSFSITTKVCFNKLSDEDINFYIDKFQPYDKAGSYAIQEWIGLVGIKEIRGDYYNIVGLPINKLIKSLSKL